MTRRFVVSLALLLASSLTASSQQPAEKSNTTAIFTSQPAANAVVAVDFKLEKLVEVPREMGSWVSLTKADDGTLIACDQQAAGLFRIKPGADGKTTVTKIPAPLSGAQGLLWAFDSLYAFVNGGDNAGLNRITDSDGDGELDKVEHLTHVPGGGEHGPHAVILSPDKKSIFVAAGNHTDLPRVGVTGSRIPRNWGEDLLLPRHWDANGHAVSRYAPGGWICRVDPDGKNWEIISVGYRNQYDIAFNADGELFSYDADMEWDMGLPWYRPTRVVHATSGSEFGWRSGTGKWPVYYEDSLPPAVDIGPGSPVGVTFGYGAKFPAKYQKALFILDWTFSTIYAIHLTPEGSTYHGEKEDFISGQPLQVTDAVVGDDGGLYFTVGGRGTQSSLYRVTYTGSESTAPVDASDADGRQTRQLRRRLESFHGEDQAKNLDAIDELVAHLGHKDRFIRYAARVGLEARPVDAWRDRLFQTDDATATINGAIALARQGNESDRQRILDVLAALYGDALDEPQKPAALRAWQLTFTRLGEATESQKQAVLEQLDPLYPANSDAVNAELVQLLVYVDSPTVVEKTIKMIENLDKEPLPEWGYLVQRSKNYGGTIGKLLANMPPLRAIHYAFVLRNQKSGWTMDTRRKYFQLFIDVSKYPGGNSYGKFLSNFRDDAFKLCTPDQQVALGDLANASLLQAPPKVNPPKGPGRKWTREEALPLVSKLQKRNIDRGRNLFHATQCAKCHRMNGEGGAIGPDLSTAGKKYPLPDLLDAIVEPSKAISDQYGSEQVLTVDGASYTGRVVRIDGKLHIYSTDPDAPPTVIDEEDVELATPSKISQMPTGLIDALNEEELKDLVAYVISGGNRRDKVHR